MPPYDRCINECCNNDKRYPERMIVHSNAKDGKLIFHKLPVNEERKKFWIHAVSKGREDFESVALHSVALHSQSVALQKVLKNPHILLMAFLNCSPEKI